MQIFEQPEQVRAAFGHCAATIGKYDGMHLGHQHILRTLCREAEAASLPTVVILSEPQPEEYFTPDKAPPRLNHFADKVDFLAQFGIDAVLRLNFDQTLSAMQAEQFVRGFLVAGMGIRTLVVGDDFRFGQGRSGDFALLERLSAELAFRPIRVAPVHSGQERISSTLVRDYLRGGDCHRVSELLDRHYSISGEVIRGRELGRQLGVPTANLRLQVNSLPATGVFAVTAELQGKQYRGVANMGYKPTVSDTKQASLEVHLFDFDADIYGQILKVSFLAKLRDEMKFGGLDQLKRQIAQDISDAEAIFAAQDAPQELAAE